MIKPHKETMAERCLMAASLAVLVFHPSSTIICFKPKSTTTTNQRQTQTPPPPPPHSKASNAKLKKMPTKSKKKQQKPPVNSSCSMFSTRLGAKNSSDPQKSLAHFRRPSPISKNGKGFDNKVLELVEEREGARGVVEIIFRSGWNPAKGKGCKIEKIMKVNHSVDVLQKFEEYRERVKSKAAKENRIRREETERSLVDGNELLRFYGCAVKCPLGFNNGGESRNCERKSCGVCRMIGIGGSRVSTMAGALSLSETSWRAHEKMMIADECVANTASSRKAVVVCRVIAGRIARCHRHGIVEGVKEDGEFDSLVCSNRGAKEITVFNPSAILPCFVVIYKAL